ncbi:hypothetical protein Tco_0935866 [Tanacetum coccineum]
MVMKEVEVKQAATKGGVFDSTANRATSAQGSVWMHPRLSVLFCLVNDLEDEPAPTRDQAGPAAPLPPKTAKQLSARRNQERVKSILLLAIPDE